MTDWKLVLRTDSHTGESEVWLDSDDGPHPGANGIVIGGGGTPLKAYRSALRELSAHTSVLCDRIVHLADEHAASLDRLAQAERDLSKTQRILRAYEAEANEQKRRCAEIAEQYQLKPPPEDQGGHPQPEHRFATIVYRMGQRITQAERDNARLKAALESAADRFHELGHPVDSLGLMLELSGAKVAFGLRQQGHYERVAEMRAAGQPWEDIAKAIGWTADAVERHFALEAGAALAPQEDK